MKIELFYKEDCPFSAKVRDFIHDFALESQIDFYDVTADPKALQKLRDYSGKEKVPCLVVEGTPIFDSVTIVDWLVKNLVEKSIIAA